MEDLSKRIAALSPAKRTLLHKKLQERSAGAEEFAFATRASRGPTPHQKRPERLPLSYASRGFGSWINLRVLAPNTTFGTPSA
jgi:hypothetical protein